MQAVKRDRKALSYPDVGAAPGATRWQVASMVHKLRHGRIEPPLPAWTQSASRWLNQSGRQHRLKREEAFTLRELKEQCPSASDQLVRKVLSEMKKEGLVTLTGRGRGARWRRES